MMNLRAQYLRRRGMVVVGLIVVTLGLAISPAVAFDHIEIDTHRDSRFLPYAFDTVQFMETTGGDPMLHGYRVVQPAIDSTVEGLAARSLNKSKVGTSAQVGFRHCLDPMHLTSDNGIWLKMVDQAAFVDSAAGVEGVIVFGTRNDSLFAARVSASEARAEVFIANGVDLTGDGVWSGEARVIGTGDFDRDGHPEMVVSTAALRDLGPRLLVCLQAEPLRIEWSFPCAARVDMMAYLPPTDSLDACLLFIGNAPGNQYSDSVFSDLYCYLFGTSLDGKLLFHKIIGYYTQWTFLQDIPQINAIYVAHTRNFSADTSGGDTQFLQGYRLTRIDRNGKPLGSVPVEGMCTDLWTADYTGDGFPELNLMFSDGSVAVYDTSFTLLARTEPSDLHGQMSQLTDWGEEGTVQVMSTARGTEIYSNRFKKLAVLGATYSYVEPTVFSASGTIEQLHGTNFKQTYFLHPYRVGWLTYASILYVDYKAYILSILFGLSVGLVSVNHYRRRTRSNLAVIGEQKKELESTHNALEAAYVALKEAQAKVIAQEKYRQARDIAGGFAHEIRNALFPARAFVTKMRSRTDDETVAAGLKHIDQAVGRAINITQLITTYTKAESECHPEPVDLVTVIDRALKNNRTRIESNGIEVHVQRADILPVRANSEQIVIVLDNLIRNALDALVEGAKPRLDLSLRSDNGTAEITVADNGPGVPDPDGERIFDMFYSTKPRTGTGVGLALSRKIVSLYGGSLTCEPSTSGARFVLRLPLDRSDS